MHSQVQGLKACRFQARVKLAPPYLEHRHERTVDELCSADVEQVVVSEIDAKV